MGKITIIGSNGEILDEYSNPSEKTSRNVAALMNFKSDSGFFKSYGDITMVFMLALRIRGIHCKGGVVDAETLKQVDIFIEEYDKVAQ